MALQVRPARKRAQASQGPVVLAALLGGAALEDIAEAENLTQKSVERLLRAELRKRWIVPAQEYARLQIARLETIAQPLKERAKEGKLPYIDRLLKVLDRLDRYHGFSKFAALTTASRDEIHAKLVARVDRAARRQASGA